ncbi:MAG: DUF4112 domain-containing protein [Leptolyngbyaceae cyanobacterium RU_5_1]|nr:DUF4112 domain-containing protein [Leptolyngbyaceae cyanobacterium RU_5_1]
MSIRPVTYKESALQRIRVVSHLLDNAIAVPGTRFRFGIDPILGLFPGAGDWLSAVLSVYIVLEALRFNLPKKILIQMVTNLVLDTAAGSVPVVGDVFDVTWKANSRNLALLENHIRDPKPQKAADRRFVILVIIGLIAILVMLTSLVVLLVSWLFRLIQGA